jgi:hopanoid biosynthesis associated RND transporter like protein HpnN
VILNLSKNFRQFLIIWVDGARRHAAAVIIASILATVGAGYYVAGNLAVNTDITDMLSPKLEFRKQSNALAKAFPQFSDNILVVIDGRTPDLAADAAIAFAARLRRQPKLFGDVYDPVGDPFFRRNGLLYQDADKLAELSDRLAEAQPFLGKLWRDPSLRGLFGMLKLAVGEALKGNDAIRIRPVLDAMSRVAEAQAKGKFADLSWSRLMMAGAENASGKEARRRLLLIQPALDFSSLTPAAAAMAALRAAAAEMKLDPAHGVRVRLTGSAALATEEFKSVENGMGLAAVISLVLVLALLVVGLRSLRLVVATLATLIVGLIWTAAFAVAAIGPFNLISVAFAVLFIGLSVDFGIHFGLRYMEERAGYAHSEALKRAASGVGLALSLAALAAAIAFYAFWPTDYLGLAELGLIAGTGMFIAFFANLTVLPAILTLLPPRPPATAAAKAKAGKADNVIRARSRIFRSIQDHARGVVWSAAAIGLAGLFLLPQARFDYDPLNLKDRGTESAATLFDLMKNPRTSPYTITILADNLKAAGAMAAKLKKIPLVDSTETLLSYVPGDQDEKLEIIEAMSLFLAPALASGDTAPPPSAVRQRAALAALESKLRLLAARPDLAAAVSAKRFLAALAALGELRDQKVLKNLEKRMLGGLGGRLKALREALAARPVSLESLPASIRERQVAGDGRAKVTVYPRENMRVSGALPRFVAAVRKVAPRATGPAVVMLEGGNAVLRAFQQATVLAFVLIAVLLLAVMRSVSDVILVFAPLFLAAVLTVAATVAMGMAFNFANVIVLPLLFGLGVAGSIHLVMRDREAAAEGVVGINGDSTPRAIVFSALTTIGSFGSIALSSHPGTASMGVLLAVSITLTLGCTLLVLPALLALRR